MSHTFFQVKTLGVEISDRVYLDRQITANLIRIAHHAKKSDYERYLESLRPASTDSLQRVGGKRTRGEKSVPQGFAYKRKR
jgi:hypothetical protein